MYSRIFRARQLFIFLFFLLSLTLLLLRLAYLQGIRHNFYSKIAKSQHSASVEIPERRGGIFDRNMRVLAVNLNNDSVYANARRVLNKRKAAKDIARALGLDEKGVRDRISRNKSFVWIKRNVSAEESSRIKALNIKGIETVKESKRFYPNGRLACHVIGTVDIDNTPLEGLELYYNRYLMGTSGWSVSKRDAKRKALESYLDEYIPPKNGLNLVLTIDEVIQNIAEREVERACEKFHAKAASIIVMSPVTGDVLALANVPGYDLNNFSNRPQDSIRNRAINDFFEPGSVFKIVTASAALEEKVVDFNDKFFCENGEYRIGRRVLHDHTPHGTMTFKEVIEKSSNIGTVKVAALLGAERMQKYMKAFGFYNKTGLDLPGEVVGMNRPLSKWSGVSMLAIPMGQEVTATAMQLACAISVIADNGYLVRPRIVKEITDESGTVIKRYPPVVVRKVISPKTAAKMRAILMGVVETGTGKKAGIEEYRVGGKTGTAQKADPEGKGYSKNRYIASFIGFAPVERPVISIVICVDEPRPPFYFGGDVAAPVFKTVADETLKYLNAKG